MASFLSSLLGGNSGGGGGELSSELAQFGGLGQLSQYASLLQGMSQYTV